MFTMEDIKISVDSNAYTLEFLNSNKWEDETLFEAALRLAGTCVKCKDCVGCTSCQMSEYCKGCNFCFMCGFCESCEHKNDSKNIRTKDFQYM